MTKAGQKNCYNVTELKIIPKNATELQITHKNITELSNINYIQVLAKLKITQISDFKLQQITPKSVIL